MDGVGEHAVAFRERRCAPPGGAPRRESTTGSKRPFARAYAATATIDLENLLVQIELTQNGRTICSMAREARDVVRGACEDIDGRLQTALSSTICTLRVDTSKCNEFPPEEADPVFRSAAR